MIKSAGIYNDVNILRSLIKIKKKFYRHKETPDRFKMVFNKIT